MPRTAGRVQNSDVSRILARAHDERLIGGLAEILTQMYEACLAPLHLYPRASKRVIYQELHYISGREELVSDSQFTAILRGRT